MKDKTTIAVIFGGKSGEHEVSLVSATSVINAIDKEKYNIIQIGITPKGSWHSGDDCLTAFKSGNYSNLDNITIPFESYNKGILVNNNFIHIDVFFPVLHGPYGEDGTIQGLFELLDIPYVGCGVLASAVSMDKVISKQIWESQNLPVTPYIWFRDVDYDSSPDDLHQNIIDKIGFPCFVKPANMGSSVGVSKVKSSDELQRALELGFSFDQKILIEKAINAKEIECAILGSETPLVCEPGEIIPGGEFYDYQDKYVDGKSIAVVPAQIESDQKEKCMKLAIEAYKALNCSGLSRVDIFIDKTDGSLYINEINTMPGFTSISMYPKMVQNHGISYEDLVDQLIEMALKKHRDKNKILNSFDCNKDWWNK